MTDKCKNLIMVDFADRDPRSFKAHLRGAGDGRQRMYEALLAANGVADLEALQEKFAIKVWNERKSLGTGNVAAPVIAPVKPLSNFAIAVVGLSLGVMLFQTFFA